MIRYQPLTRVQIEAVRTLRDVWRDTPFRLMGATALACHLDRRWRKTDDLDFTLAVSPEAVPAGLETLPGWSRHPAKEHEWLGPHQLKVDVLPAGAALLAAREVVWPRTGRRMSLVGFRHVFDRSESLVLAEDLTIEVAALPVIGLLKMVSYLDRPYERERDLEDLGYILDEYVDAADARRFSEPVFAAGVDFDSTGAFLFGWELGGMVDDEERAVVRRFVSKARDDRDEHTTCVRMVRCGPQRWMREPEALWHLLDAFERGLSQAS